MPPGFHSEKVGGSKARFSFPLFIFICSFILSPLIFLGIVLGEHKISGFIANLSLPRFKTETRVKEGDNAKEPCDYRHPLDNTCLKEAWKRKKIIAVSIDNMVDARPQAGIASARLVIEAPVEAGISRLLAFYGEGDAVPSIGPVRSARPYFLDFAKEYRATLAHVGGSPEALSRIEEEKFDSIDEIKNGSAFWRDGRRSAPHATFTSAENLFSISKSNADIRPFMLAEEKAADQRKKGSSLRIAAAFSAYEVQWKYDAEKNAYERLQAGATHKDNQDMPIFAKNVVVLRMPIEVIDDVGRREIGTTGTGDAIIFRNGETIEGTWKRNSLSERTVFTDKNGNEIGFVPGPMWMEIVSKTAKVEYN